MSTAVSIRLSDDIAHELEGLARPMERSRTYIIRNAIESYLQEYADYSVAIERLNDKGLKNRMREKYLDIVIETIPGISSITAFASRIDVGIDRSFVVSDGSPITTKIMLKTRTPKKIRDDLIEEGYTDFTFAEKRFSDEGQLTVNR